VSDRSDSEYGADLIVESLRGQEYVEFNRAAARDLGPIVSSENVSKLSRSSRLSWKRRADAGQVQERHPIALTRSEHCLRWLRGKARGQSGTAWWCRRRLNG
jgi:hypothetical protein